MFLQSGNEPEEELETNRAAVAIAGDVLVRGGSPCLQILTAASDLVGPSDQC